MLDIKDFGAVGDGIHDDTDALQDAVNAAYTDNEYLYISPGNYAVENDTIMPFDSSNAFNRGNYIYGAGMLRSNIIAQAPNIAIFKYTQPALNKFMMGGMISGLSLSGNGQAGCTGISAQALFSHQFQGLYIDGFKYGVELVNKANPGDSDASNHIALDNSRIVNCSQWGFYSNLRSGNNENSFLSFRNSTIEGCGTTAGAVGGGMYWRGQMMQFDNSAFVLNKNRGLYIEGGAGLGSNVLCNNLTFENNIGIHVQCYGITGMEFNNLQMYSNDMFKAQYGLYFNGGTSLVSNVRVNSAKIRATAGNNPYIAFVATGANAVNSTIVADSKQIRWDNFGYAGQTQYLGFTVV